MLHFLNRRGMVDRVDEVPKFQGAIAATLQCLPPALSCFSEFIDPLDRTRPHIANPVR
jgi:hypothetical protein